MSEQILYCADMSEHVSTLLESATDLGILFIKHFRDQKTPITERTISES